MSKYSFRGIKCTRQPKKLIIPVLVLFQLILNTSVGSAWISPANSETVPHGVTVNGQQIGGLNREQAVAFLDQNNSFSFVDENIFLKNQSREWCLPTIEYDFRYDSVKTVDKILDEQQWAESTPGAINLLKMQARNLDIPREISWHEKRLDAFLKTINEEIMIPATNAGLDVIDSQILIIDEQAGEEIDFESTVISILQSIRSFDTNTVNIVKKPLVPEIAASDLSGVDSVLAYFDTEIKNTDKNRTNNIILASQILDGTIIMPDDIFSFNKVIGERSLEKGFKYAPAIFGYSVKQEVGGGICQVATTLYNASLLSGLEIIERSTHTIPVKYAPHGQDATVYYGLIDLKIKNNLPELVMIDIRVIDNTLIISICGNHKNKVNL